MSKFKKKMYIVGNTIPKDNLKSMPIMKILFLGERHCGKTCLARVLNGDKFDERYYNPGIDFRVKIVPFKNESLTLQMVRY